MRVLIDQGFFGRPEALSLPFLEVFALARDGRHTVLTRPVFADGDEGPIADWLNDLPDSVAALRDGFGSKIADLFDRDPAGHEDAFRAEFERGRRPDEPTREAILTSLFARL